MNAGMTSIGFSGEKTGALPAGWVSGLTGRGSPRWAVEADPAAPAAPPVLVQSGSATFAWCVRAGVALADGFVETRFKSISGREDQAGGVVWRWKDGDNYYVARANALEDNVSLYYTEKGSRKTIRYVDAAVPGNTWHHLRVEFRGTGIRVILNGRACIEAEDSHISGEGSVGLWTKADSRTAFDDFGFGPLGTQSTAEHG